LGVSEPSENREENGQKQMHNFRRTLIISFGIVSPLTLCLNINSWPNLE